MALAKDDNIWRRFVNTLPEVPDDGADAPQMENIPKKKRSSGKKFNVQKIVTEIYVYTDLQGHAFNEITFQDLFLLGDMTEAQLNKLLAAESHKRHSNED